MYILTRSKSYRYEHISMRAAHLRPCSLSRYTTAFFLACFFTLINIATVCATEEGQAPPARHNISKGSAYLTQEEQHWLATHDKLTVRTMSSWPPMNFTSPHGEPVGIGVDILRLFEKWSGITLQIEAGPFSDNLEAVKNRKVAALMDVTPKPAREKYLHFTRPYLTIPHVIIGRIDGPYYHSEKDLAGKTVALEEGFYNILYFQKNHPEVRITKYPDTKACLLAVAKKSADAYAGNQAVANFIIAQQVLANLQVQGTLKKPVSTLSIGVRKDWPVLAALFDKFLMDLPVVEKQKVLRHWVHYEQSEMRKSPLRLTEQEKTWLETHKIIQVGVHPFWAPLETGAADLP